MTSYTTDTTSDARALSSALADYGYASEPAGRALKSRITSASEDEVRRIAEDAGIAVSTEEVRATDLESLLSLVP